MTPEDRDLLLSLRRQQTELQQSLESIHAKLGALESRVGITAADALLPDLPPVPWEAMFPPIPAASEEAPALALPPIPSDLGTPALPAIPATAHTSSHDFQFGRWLMRFGALFIAFALALVLAWPRVHDAMGPAGLLGVSAVVSLFAVIFSGRMERKGGTSFFIGRTITVAALAWLYLAIYTACFNEQQQAIQSPLFAGLLLFAWSLYALFVAERRKSQLFALFAIALGYFSTAITPIGAFTMGADLILAATAGVFLMRLGWTTLAAFSVVGTYVALFRRLLFDSYGDFIFDTSRALSFTPHAIYLGIAWLIFTASIILCREQKFRGGKRLALVSLNNAGLAGLLALTAYIAGYGASAIGWTLLDTGLVFLVTSRFAGAADVDPVDLMGSYAAQGLALFTGGIIVIFTGITRAVLLLVETFLIGIAGAFAGDRILIVSTYVAAFFATMFLMWEIAIHAHHPWLFGFAGALVMLINAWNTRSEVRNGPQERSTIVFASSCYCLLAIGLIYAALYTALGDATLPVALALVALILTFVIYQFSIYELPASAQILLIAAQIMVVFPAETGEDLPWWTTASVAIVTLVLLTWYSRQRLLITGGWTVTLMFLYALVLADLAHLAIRPYLDAQGWMIGASLLSFAFLVYGAFNRVWSLAAVGQLFLALALYHFFFPPQPGTFPWTWLAAAVPGIVLYATARAAQEWLKNFTEVVEPWRSLITWLSYVYLVTALAALVRWIFGIAPGGDPVATASLLFFFGTFVLSTSVHHFNSFGVRCSFVLSLIGTYLYAAHALSPAIAPTFFEELAVFLFLAQSPLLRHEARSLVTPGEIWALAVVSAAAGWLLVSQWVMGHHNAHYLTMGWALYALFLFLFGTFVRERPLRWCGLAIIVVTIFRVLCWEVWRLSPGMLMLTGILTFFTLALILLVVGYVILLRSGQPANVTTGH